MRYTFVLSTGVLAQQEPELDLLEFSEQRNLWRGGQVITVAF